MTQFETGEQLFESLLNKSNFSVFKNKNPLKLDTKIFTSEFEFGDVLEISGKTGSAKSELIINLISSFLLPGKWIVDLKVENEIKKIQIDLNKWSFFPELTNSQLKLKVILVENDLKFCILKLISILEYRIKYCVKTKQQTGDPLASKISRSNLDIFIKSCLSNLLVYKCNSSEQFLFTLASCEFSIKQEQQQHAKSQNTFNFFMPIFIDTINSNFEFIDPLLLNSADHTEKFTISLINRILTKFKNYVIIIASRIEYEPSTNKYETNTYSYSKWQKIVTKRIKLSKLSNCEDFHFVNNLNEEHLFKIGNSGFVWKDI